MILLPEVLAIVILNSIFVIFASIALFFSIKIYLYWDMNLTTKRQYTLEKQSFLVSTIIKYIFSIKIPLFLFFIFTLDKISTLITGAMCGVGVVTATDYGIYLLIIKIINIYFFGLWLTIHSLDIKNPNLPYTKLKFELYIVAYIFFMVEIILMWFMFSGIDTNKIVSCCGTLFSSAGASTISNILKVKTSIILTLFYGATTALIIFYRLRVKYLFALSNMVFLIISLISLISLFGTYIYELPTHHCPFCFLQSDYYYIGYLIYTLLFIGSFYGFRVGVMEILKEDSSSSYFYSIIFNMLYVLLVSIYPIIYFIKNGVWLN